MYKRQEFNDPLFRAACRKYRALQEETRSIKMLKAAQNTVDKFIDYFNNIVIYHPVGKVANPTGWFPSGTL